MLQGSVVRETQEYQILPTRCLAVANAAALSLSFLPNAYRNLKGKYGCLLDKPTGGSRQNQNSLMGNCKGDFYRLIQSINYSGILHKASEINFVKQPKPPNLQLCGLTASSGIELSHQQCQTCGRAFCCKC